MGADIVMPAAAGAGGGTPPDSRKRAKVDSEAGKLARVAKIVMVLSAMGKMRGGRDPTLPEKSLMAKAREKLARVCGSMEPHRQKDHFTKEMAMAVVVDHGLNPPKDNIPRPPKSSIAEKVVNTKRKEGKTSRTAAEAVDYKGFPVDRTKTGGWVSAALVLGIEICERMSTMGIAMNLVMYMCNTMHLPSSESANIVTDFMGTSFLLCLFGGFLADALLGRFKTITIFSAIQILGTGMLSVSTRLRVFRPPPCAGGVCQRATGLQMGILYLSLYLIALGTGELKFERLRLRHRPVRRTRMKKDKAQMAYFFNWFFFFISTGTLLAVTVLFYIQDEVSRSLDDGVCSISMSFMKSGYRVTEW